jgi:PAS domain S-box-containing protein
MLSPDTAIRDEQGSDDAFERRAQALELVVDSMGDGVIVIDKDGTFKLFNAAAREILGQGPSDRPMKDWARIYGVYLPGNSSPASDEHLPLARALRGERIDNFHLLMRPPTNPEGFYIAVTARPITDPAGEITGAVAVLRDITDQKKNEADLREAREELERRVVERTLSLARANRELNNEIEERRQAEIALKASERQLRLMADSLPLSLAYVDARQRYILSNETYNHWFGIKGEDVRGRPVWEILGIERYKTIRPHIEQALAGRHVVTQSDIQHPELGWRQIQLNLVPDRDDAGKIQGYYAIGLDMTERNEAEVLERKHREELAHVARVSTMGELAAALAHELNQQLTSIRTNAQTGLLLAQSGRADADDTISILTDIIDDNRRATEVIRRLRAMLRKRPMTLEKLDLEEVIHETMTLVRNDAILRGVALEVKTTPDLPHVRADRIQLQQVLLNLVVNGFEAMRDLDGDKSLTIRSSFTSVGDICVCV